jgi:hypothetical protein
MLKDENWKKKHKKPPKSTKQTYDPSSKTKITSLNVNWNKLLSLTHSQSSINQWDWKIIN